MLAGYLVACTWYRALIGCSASNLPEHTTLAGYVAIPDDKARFLADLTDEVCRAHGIGRGAADAILDSRPAGASPA